MRGKILIRRGIHDTYGILIGEPIRLVPCAQPHVFPSETTHETFLTHFSDNQVLLDELKMYDLTSVEIIATI